jgi:glycosyltransferase involved in cell wall biosynthesis
LEPSRKIRLAYVVNLPIRWVAFEWIARDLDRDQFTLSFVLLNDGPPPAAPESTDKAFRPPGQPAVHTQVVAIDKLVWRALRAEGVSARKLRLVNHGFDLEQFRNVAPERIQRLRDKYLPPGAAPVIGVASRFVEWKGIGYTLAAFRRLLTRYPSAFLILAGAYEPHEKDIYSLVRALPEGRFITIAFEAALQDLYRSAYHSRKNQ